MNHTSVKPKRAGASLPAAIIVPNAREVRSYLREHPDLMTLVSRICERALSEFGERADLTLEVYRDPEFDDAYLTLCVQLPRYDATTTKRIDAVWEAFEADLCKSTGWLIMTTDFRRKAPKHGV